MTATSLQEGLDLSSNIFGCVGSNPTSGRLSPPAGVETPLGIVSYLEVFVLIKAALSHYRRGFSNVFLQQQSLSLASLKGRGRRYLYMVAASAAGLRAI